VEITDKVVLSASPIRTVKVSARDEVFRIVQLQGNLFVCSKAHGNCCCGWTEKGRAPVKVDIYQQEWERRRLRNKLHLSFTSCLGPCAVGNSALLQLVGRSIWFNDLNDDKFIPLIFDYVQALLKDHQALPPPELLEHIYERYLPSPTASSNPTALSVGDGTGNEVEESGLEGIDPVCLMEVDPATARWKSEYEGRTFYFCAKSCKKEFDSDPLAYL